MLGTARALRVCSGARTFASVAKNPGDGTWLREAQVLPDDRIAFGKRC